MPAGPIHQFITRTALGFQVRMPFVHIAGIARVMMFFL